MQGIVTSDNSVRAGIELSVLRNWSKNPKKGKLAAKLLRQGIISIEQYMELEDGRNTFWNDRDMVTIFTKTGLDIYGIAASISISPNTITKYILDGNDKVKSRLEQLKANLGV